MYIYRACGALDVLDVVSSSHCAKALRGEVFLCNVCVCVCVCVDVCMFVCMYVCMYTYICMYIRMYVCMYVCI